MRMLIRIPGAALVILGAMGLLAPRAARAVPVIDVVFTERNGAAIGPTSELEAGLGDLLTASVRISADAQGVSSYSLSVHFDADLDLRAVDETRPGVFEIDLDPGPPPVVESTDLVVGEILSLTGASLGPGAVDLRFEIASLEFEVTADVASDGPDIQPGFFIAGVDGLFDSAGGDLIPSAELRGASVNVIPEPASALLVAGGLAALTGFARRRATAARA